MSTAGAKVRIAYAPDFALPSMRQKGLVDLFSVERR